MAQFIPASSLNKKDYHEVVQKNVQPRFSFKEIV